MRAGSRRSWVSERGQCCERTWHGTCTGKAVEDPVVRHLISIMELVRTILREEKATLLTRSCTAAHWWASRADDT